MMALAAADATVRELRKELEQKANEAEQELAGMQKALESAMGFLGIASTGRAGFLPQI